MLQDVNKSMNAQILAILMDEKAEEAALDGVVVEVSIVVDSAVGELSPAKTE